MSTTRLLLRSTMSKPLNFGSVEPSLSRSSKKTSSETTCPDKLVFTADHLHRRKLKPPTVVAPERSITVDHPWATELVANVSHATITLSKLASKWRPKISHVQMLIEKTIIDCRFFTLFGVAGTLLGSVLCFIEGCFTVLQSYIQYFHLMSQNANQGYVIHLLIEALDMFLTGTAMLIFGVSLYSMFIGSNNQKDTRDRTIKRHDSNLFGLCSSTCAKLPAWVELDSVSQASLKIGHAVMIILQVGVLEKFKSVPLHSGLDLACLSVVLLFCSASIFILSRLSPGRTVRQDNLKHKP